MCGIMIIFLNASREKTHFTPIRKIIGHVPFFPLRFYISRYGHLSKQICSPIRSTIFSHMLTVFDWSLVLSCCFVIFQSYNILDSLFDDNLVFLNSSVFPLFSFSGRGKRALSLNILNRILK